VKSLAGWPFFEKVRGKAIVSLYTTSSRCAFRYEGNASSMAGLSAARVQRPQVAPAPPLRQPESSTPADGPRPETGEHHGNL